MLLGDLLARFDDETVAEEAVTAPGDLALIAKLREKAAADGVTLGAYVATAVCRYAAEASAQEWVTLMGALERAADPGRVCMQRAFAHVLGEPYKSKD
jgi:hypothetical protein